MPRSKYKFNNSSLQFEQVEATTGQRIWRVLLYVTLVLLTMVLGWVIINQVLDSPKEKMLLRENAQYEFQIELMTEQMDQLQLVLDDMADRDDNIYRVIFEADPVPNEIRKAGYGGVDRYASLQGYNNSDVIIEASKKLDMLISQTIVQSKSFDEVYEMAKNKEMMLASIPAIQPVSNKDLTRLASFYGWRTDPIYKVQKFHHGIDFTAPKGTEIYATGDGVVKTVKKSRRGYGNQIIIDHGYGYETRFAHLQSFNVRKGQKVKRGEVIGFVGNSGKSTAPHLHYEVIKDGRDVNPIYYFFNDITPEEYDKMLELSQRPSQSLD